MIFYFAGEGGKKGEGGKREDLPLKENKGIGALFTFHTVPKEFHSLIATQDVRVKGITLKDYREHADFIDEKKKKKKKKKGKR